MILGVGAGWQEREHRLFGYDLGTVPTRMKRLEEGLEVITRLLRKDEPVTYEGKFFQLREAALLPHVQHNSPSILVGGNGVKHTLALAARYADIWNGDHLSPQEFHKRSKLLDDLLQAQGRQPGDVKRTLVISLIFGHTWDECNQRLCQKRPEWADLPMKAILDALGNSGIALIGTPELLLTQIQTYVNAGVEEFMLVWHDLDDIKGLQSFASNVLPYINQC